MRFLLVAILFAVAVAAFTLITTYGYQGRLEAELSQQAKVALNEAGLNDVEVNFQYHTAILSGEVESRNQQEQALQIVAETLPMAIIPPLEKAAIRIKPTLSSVVKIERPAGSDIVKLSGVFSASGESNRELLAGRLAALEEVETVENTLKLDPRQLPFPNTAALASLTEILIKHPGRTVVALEAGQLTMIGEVPNHGLKAGVMELASLIDGVSIDDQVTVLEADKRLKPSHFNFTRNRFGITVSGSLANKEDRAALLKTIRSADSKLPVKSRVEISEDYVRGVWEENATEILPVVLTSLNGELTAEFTSEGARINGEVTTEEEYSKVRKTLEEIISQPNAPSILMDVSVKDSKSEGPEIQLLAKFNDGTLTFTGKVPSSAFFRELEKEMGESKITLVNNMEETPSSEGETWVDQLALFFGEFEGRLHSGVVNIKNSKLKLEGETLEPSAKLMLQNVAVNILPGSFTIDNRLKNKEEEVLPAPRLATKEKNKLRKSLKALSIYFDSNSEVVDREGKENVEKIATLIEEAGVPLKLMVTGFADNLGSAEHNRELSLRRANSVMVLMIENGINRDTMTADSVGEDVSNVSRSERWKARRVEVSIANDPEDAGKSEQ
ncbi:MAG: OmpA family protein [Verrucomicrobiota bacterium]|nr:OmpA family protein [Verrucomicrobiota bacterium]